MSKDQWGGYPTLRQAQLILVGSFRHLQRADRAWGTGIILQLAVSQLWWGRDNNWVTCLCLSSRLARACSHGGREGIRSGKGPLRPRLRGEPITSFCWPKQVTMPAQIQEVGRKTPLLGGGRCKGTFEKTGMQGGVNNGSIFCSWPH